jgi:hypothetical protein
MDPVTIGADIGQKRDPTAIVVASAEQRTTGRKTTWGFWSESLRDRPLPDEYETIYTVRHMERLPLGTAYPKVGERITEIVRNVHLQALPESRGVNLIVDATGVGRPVVDIIRSHLEQRIDVTAATFTHGDRLDGRLCDQEVSVGKGFLVSRLQVLLQTECLQLPANHAEALAMMEELENYEIKVDENANEKYGAFEVGTHDDLVTALGLAVLFDPFNSGNAFFSVA